MASNTNRLGLLKKDPVADGNDTFNIKAMLNDNWDAIDAKVAVLGPDGKVPAEQLSVATPADASTAQKGVVQLEDSTTSTSITKAATANAVKMVNEDFATHEADGTSHVRYGTASGTNAKTITLNPKPTALVEGMAISFKNTTANSGAVTLNINSLGAKPVIKSNGNPIAAGNLRMGGIYTVRYDGASFVLQGEGASGNAIASDLLSGKTASTDAGDIVGTMPNRGTFNLGLGVSVPAGYYSGGTTANGKRWASGTVTSSSELSQFVATGSTTSLYAMYSIEITSLSFKPSFIFATAYFPGSGNLYNTIYSEVANFYPKTVQTSVHGNGVKSGAYSYNLRADESPAYVNSIGFRLPVQGSSVTAYQWYAFE